MALGQCFRMKSWFIAENPGWKWFVPIPIIGIAPIAVLVLAKGILIEAEEEAPAPLLVEVRVLHNLCSILVEVKLKEICQARNGKL